jgi:capsular polysaccharide biosynthesis protein
VTEQNPTDFRPNIIRDAVRRHVLLILTLMLGLGALAAVAGARAPRAQVSTAAVLVHPLYGNPFSPEGQGNQLTNLETEAQLVTGDAVAGVVAKEVKPSATPSELVRSTRAKVTENTQIVQITATARDADAARERAQAFAEAYLDYREQRAKTLIDGQVKLLRQQQSTTADQLSRTSRRLAAENISSADRALVTEQLRTLTAELTRLTSTIAEQLAIPTDPGQIVSPADTPADAGLSPAITYGIGGLVAGLVVGFLIGLARERLDDRLRDESDLDRAGVLPLGMAGAGPGGGEESEDLRRVRTAVRTAVPALPATIVIGSADPGIDAPSIAGPLAIALARSGATVCLVDCAATQWVGQDLMANTGDGLADVLLSGTRVDAALRRPLTEVPELAVVPRGRWNGRAADQLGNLPMRRAVAHLSESFDVVLIASPSLQSADGQVLARMADAVVIEAAVSATTTGQLLRTLSWLSRGDVLVLGCVLVRLAPKRGWLRRKNHRPRMQHAVTTSGRVAAGGIGQPAESGTAAGGRSSEQAHGERRPGAGANRPHVLLPPTPPTAPTTAIPVAKQPTHEEAEQPSGLVDGSSEVMSTVGRRGRDASKNNGR